MKGKAQLAERTTCSNNCKCIGYRFALQEMAKIVCPGSIYDGVKCKVLTTRTAFCAPNEAGRTGFDYGFVVRLSNGVRLGVPVENLHVADPKYWVEYDRKRA